jgi:exosome complex component RRP42
MANMDVSNLSKEYLGKILAEGKRFDKRDLLDLRDIAISYDVSNKAEGSARVKMGKTEVVVGIKVGIGEPYPDSPDKGNLMCTAELLQMASPRFESGPPGFKAIELGRMVDRAVRESGMIELDKLCIEKGEKVWTIFIDIYPINDDGNLLDAATLGAVAALKNAKMPAIDKDGKIDYTKRKNPAPINKDIFPLSFSFYKIGNSIIMDPTREEEESADTRITFGISKYKGQNVLNSCQKIGRGILTQEEVEKIMQAIPKKYEELIKKLKI